MNYGRDNQRMIICSILIVCIYAIVTKLILNDDFTKGVVLTSDIRLVGITTKIGQYSIASHLKRLGVE